ASAAVDRVLIEAQEAEAAIDLAAEAFEFEPDRLEKAEERLFDLRGLARKLGVSVEELPLIRVRFAVRLRAAEGSGDELKAAEAALAAARQAYMAEAQATVAARREAVQLLVVTHSQQVAARADAHWRIAKAGEGERLRTAVEALFPDDREEEIARMLAGAQITDAARAAARALIGA